PGAPLRFLSTIAHFGTSEDVTVRDLRLELLFPADEATRARLQSGA
ncbi:MAG: transcriptional regulator, partial [Alphaproteobacteria bacterium]|nr:transcriptional regulator [Alphaproteobacteria bacterium]